ncbi:MAG: electron transfer flavoprotein subunit alpha/FixB family protein [Alphaproteobacteria bacterium]|nr:electron transfer flavoprotein subunit alpha [Rhodobiaceae bacterium]MDC0071498.1 FAD-binding protein [Rhodobiaceae bacterium]MDC0184828.1 FAD-binding protein [Rhodobiaceae bacterium]PDH51302.1 MAG: electron transfer flavoprotein subunit alpha [alpha proteobacterium MED-G09]|tara:strand:+ start:987 stop:1916 length:930 start_codon:yes stop_codon:yes gene_type:complete
MTTLLIAEHDNKILNEANKKAMDAATKIGEEVHVLVAGKDCSEIADEVSKIAGVSKVLLCDNPVYEKHMAESYADLVVEISSDYNAILTTASTTGKNFMPRVAALLDVPQISEIINVIDSNTFERPIYAGNAIQTVKSLSDKKIITVRAPSFQAVENQDPATVENIQNSEDKNLSEYISEELTKSDRPELTAAKIIISGGRGMQNGENFVLLEGVADKLGAALGASRAAVDAGFVPNDYQVGQTGKVVAPELYIAVGISGAIQHLAGMKDSKVIVAINKDEEAPIFQVADYGLVADLFKAIPDLNTALG